MVLFIQLIIGTAMIGLSVMIQAIALDLIMRHIRSASSRLKKHMKENWRILVMGSAVIMVFLVNVLIVWLWAALYHVLSCAPLANFSEALYFATVVYSTLGFGDIVLEAPCRMLSGIEGANGFILFGWTAAFIFEVFGQVYSKEVKPL